LRAEPIEATATNPERGQCGRGHYGFVSVLSGYGGREAGSASHARQISGRQQLRRRQSRGRSHARISSRPVVYRAKAVRNKRGGAIRPVVGDGFWAGAVAAPENRG